MEVECKFQWWTPRREGLSSFPQEGKNTDPVLKVPLRGCSITTGAFWEQSLNVQNFGGGIEISEETLAPDSVRLEDYVLHRSQKESTDKRVCAAVQ